MLKTWPRKHLPQICNFPDVNRPRLCLGKFYAPSEAALGAARLPARSVKPSPSRPWDRGARKARPQPAGNSPQGHSLSGVGVRTAGGSPQPETESILEAEGTTQGRCPPGLFVETTRSHILPPEPQNEYRLLSEGLCLVQGAGWFSRAPWEFLRATVRLLPR